MAICAQLFAVRLQLPPEIAGNSPNIVEFAHLDALPNMSPGEHLVQYISRDMEPRRKVYCGIVNYLLGIKPELSASDIHILFTGDDTFQVEIDGKSPNVTRIRRGGDLSYCHFKQIGAHRIKGTVTTAGDLLRHADSMTVDEILQLSRIKKHITQMEINAKEGTQQNYVKNEIKMRECIINSSTFSFSQPIEDIISMCEREQNAFISSKFQGMITKQYGLPLPLPAASMISAYCSPSVSELITYIKNHFIQQVIEANSNRLIRPMDRTLNYKFTRYNKGILSIKTSDILSIGFGIEFLCMTKDMDMMQRNKLLLKVIPQILTNHFILSISRETTVAQQEKDLEDAVRQIILATIEQNEY
jgi:hypothetical protein